MTAVAAAENPDRDHDGITDLADVIVVSSALAALGPDARAEEMLFLGMPAARRMKLDATKCGTALAESHADIASLRQVLGS